MSVTYISTQLPHYNLFFIVQYILQNNWRISSYMITNQMYVTHINFVYYVRLATCFNPYRIIIRPSIESSH